MALHTYHNFQYAVLESCDWRCADGHLIHLYFRTTHYEEIVWC
jgi:hypothetical protein